MKILKIIALAFAFNFITSCNNVEVKQNPINNDAMLYATVYQQKAAEVVALYYQAYNIAELRLNQALENNHSKKPLAIVVDVDETILDNSPFEAKSILENSDYPTYWKEWIELANAKALPGALEFLNNASAKGVETFYITNRKVEFHDATMKNLKDMGFPNVDETHLLMRTNESNKEARRSKVLETHEIVLLIGDNLNDFTELFEANSVVERLQNVNNLKSEFGKKFIILPNAMYGAWIDVFFNDPDLTKAQKIQRLKEALEAF